MFTQRTRPKYKLISTITTRFRTGYDCNHIPLVAHINVNDSLCYHIQEHRSFEFQPNLSNGRQSDQVAVPNVPLFSAIPHIETFHPLFKWGIKLTIQQETDPFRVSESGSLIFIF